MSDKFCMYPAKCPNTGLFLGFSFAKLTDKPKWGWVQASGVIDGAHPITCGVLEISEPICQSLDTLSNCEIYEAGYPIVWDSPEGRKVYQYHLMVLDETKGVWGKEAIPCQPGEPFVI